MARIEKGSGEGGNSPSTSAGRQDLEESGSLTPFPLANDVLSTTVLAEGDIILYALNIARRTP